MIFDEDSGYFDPEDFYKDELLSWRSYWDFEANPYQNLSSLLKRIILLPKSQTFLPLVCTYLMQPTRPARCLPILFSHGAAGSGKTTLAQIGARLRGRKTVLTVNDTFAAIRNELEFQGYYARSHKEYRKEGAMLCYDNVSIKALKAEPRIYQMLLVGYNIRSSQMQIATKEYTNEKFETFCPKIISSIDPLHTHPVYTELQRRLWTIPHKRIEDFTPSDLAEAGTSLEEFYETAVDIESVSWKGIDSVFYEFWTLEKVKEYVALRSWLSTTKAKKSLGIADKIPSDKWAISIDPICTGICIGTWRNALEAVNHLSAYYDFLKDLKDQDLGLALSYIKEYMSREIDPLRRANLALEEAGKPSKYELSLDPLKLRNYLKSLYDNGHLTEQPNNASICEWMDYLGWKLTPKGWAIK